jgi:integrase
VKDEVRSLPLDLWPEPDCSGWSGACRPAARLKRGGAAAHLKPVSRNALVRGYGAFLGFLRRDGLLRSDGPPGTNVTPDNVDAYVAELKDRVSSVTVYSAISQLRRAAQCIAPESDFAWLAEIERELASVMRPRSKFDRIVMPEVLLEAGLSLIHEAESSSSRSDLARARQVRNGLMVALLALCPIRLKNYVALEIGRSLVEIRGRWWIVLSAAETKENRPDERPIDKLLAPFLERYLRQHRPVFARTGNCSSALWLSSPDGAPLSYVRVGSAIRMTTLETVGIEVSPHLFRTCGVSGAATYCSDNPYLGSALLHHTDPRVTNANYNRATSLTAAESLRQIVRAYDRK